MSLLVRRQTDGPQGESLDREFDSGSVLIGPEADCDLVLPGLEQRLTARADAKGQVTLNARPRLEIGGRKTSRLRLGAGEQISLAGYEIAVFAPPPGFDSALLISGSPRLSPLAGTLARVEQGIRPFSIRRTGYVLALLILTLGLILPFIASREPATARLLASARLPMDTAWSSGPLHTAHRAAGLEMACSSCHAEPFVMVRDEACTGCHMAMHEHAEVSAFPVLAMERERCGGCHREHNEPERLARRDNGLCVDCHASPPAWGAATDVAAVHRFTAEAHPEFKVSLWQPEGEGAARGWSLTRVRQSPQQLSDPSHLKFNHAVHMDADKVQTQGAGEALVCASCHTLKDDGEHFELTTMDQHCRSCHQLNFDPFDPDLELPHGEARAAFVAMEAHFIREFTDPVLRAERAMQKPRRLPGKRMGAASCEGEGLACGQAEAEKEAQYQFAETGCVTCHDVRRMEATAPIDRWFVHPVRLTTDWYSQSRFDHRSHLSLGGRSGDGVCLDCHAATESESATDVLIPAQDNCLQCHDAAQQSVAVDCVGCHVFHREQGTPSIDARPGHALPQNQQAARGGPSP